MYVDARENYSETELKNRASVCEQRQFNAAWSGGQARQGRERQPSIAERNIWMTLYYLTGRNISFLIFLLCCNVDFSTLGLHLNYTDVNRVLFYTTQKIRHLSSFSELGCYLICLYTYVEFKSKLSSKN